MASYIIEIYLLAIACPSLAAPEVGGRGGGISGAFGLELHYYGHMVAEQRAIVLKIVVGIEGDGVWRELHSAVGGVEVEHLVHDFILNIGTRLGLVGIGHDECIGSKRGIGAVLALLHPHIAYGIVAVGHNGVCEEIEDVVACVAAVGITHHDLGQTAVVGENGIAKLLPLRSAGGIVLGAGLGIHVHDVEFHNDALAEVHLIISVSLGDEFVGTVGEVSVVLCPCRPTLVAEGKAILHKKLQAVGGETQVFYIEIACARDGDAAAPCARLVVVTGTFEQTAVVVEVLAQSNHVDAALGDILSDLLRTVGTWSVRIEVVS